LALAAEPPPALPVAPLDPELPPLVPPLPWLAIAAAIAALAAVAATAAVAFAIAVEAASLVVEPLPFLLVCCDNEDDEEEEVDGWEFWELEEPWGALKNEDDERDDEGGAPLLVAVDNEEEGGCWVDEFILFPFVVCATTPFWRIALAPLVLALLWEEAAVCGKDCCCVIIGEEIPAEVVDEEFVELGAADETLEDGTWVLL